MSLERKYIYGIIEEAKPMRFSFLGVGDAEVYTINHRELAAVVSDTALEEIDPTRKDVRAHTVVQDEVLKNCSLLPMGFGMIADSKDDVLKLLEKNYQGLSRELVRLAGKVEVELKVFWDQEAMMRQLEGGNRELDRIKERIRAASSPVETQRLLMQAGKLVERVVLDWKAKYAQRAYNNLKQFSVDARLNNPIGVKNILNASFLIDKSKESEFQKEIYKLDAEYQGKVNFKYVGPLPPYNFVQLKLMLHTKREE
jgi:hypothetical protein